MIDVLVPWSAGLVIVGIVMTLRRPRRH